MNYLRVEKATLDPDQTTFHFACNAFNKYTTGKLTEHSRKNKGFMLPRLLSCLFRSVTPEQTSRDFVTLLLVAVPLESPVRSRIADCNYQYFRFDPRFSSVLENVKWCVTRGGVKWFNIAVLLGNLILGKEILIKEMSVGHVFRHALLVGHVFRHALLVGHVFRHALLVGQNKLTHIFFLLYCILQQNKSFLFRLTPALFTLNISAKWPYIFSKVLLQLLCFIVFIDNFWKTHWFWLATLFYNPNSSKLGGINIWITSF